VATINHSLICLGQPCCMITSLAIQKIVVSVSAAHIPLCLVKSQCDILLLSRNIECNSFLNSSFNPPFCRCFSDQIFGSEVTQIIFYHFSFSSFEFRTGHKLTPKPSFGSSICLYLMFDDLPVWSLAGAWPTAAPKLIHHWVPTWIFATASSGI
jgi:hypothetical protein